MARVTLTSVTKTYGAETVIPHLDLDIFDGEFLVLIGPSGSGKSTLLRMIAGLEDVTSGVIAVDGRDITHADPSDRDMAMVFQSYALYPHMTVAENMSFALRMRKVPPDEIATRVGDAVQMLELSGLERRKPAQLSGGQRQRVAMGRAIVRKPQLFLFDEPLSNLDAKLRAQTRLEIRRLHERLGATSIFVTHDQVEAMTTADRIALLDKGMLQQIGTPQDFYLRPANRLVAGFIGTPEMNFFRGTLLPTAEGFVLNGSVRLTLPTSAEFRGLVAAQIGPGREVEIGVRPEHFLVLSADSAGTLPLTVEANEWMGHDVFLFVKPADRLVAIRVSTMLETTGHQLESPKAGDRIAIRAAPDCWHLFDGTSGRNLLLTGD